MTALPIKRLIGSAAFFVAGLAMFFGPATPAEAAPAAGEIESCLTAGRDIDCVDHTGWGVSIVYPDGSDSDNFGPESYTVRYDAGHLYYTFSTGATPYGPPVFPNFDY